MENFSDLFAKIEMQAKASLTARSKTAVEPEQVHKQAEVDQEDPARLPGLPLSADQGLDRPPGPPGEDRCAIAKDPGRAGPPRRAKTSPSRIACPNCGRLGSRVYSIHGLTRYRRCQACAFRFSTIETLKTKSFAISSKKAENNGKKHDIS